MDDRTEREILARLDYIERYLVQLSGPAGIRYTPFAVSMRVALEVAELARQGRTDEAIKQFRAVTHANLQQAEDVIAQIQAGDRSVFGSAPGAFDPRQPGSGEWSEEMPLGGFMADEAGGYIADGVAGYIAADGVGSDIVALAQSGRMIEAIKMYRQRTGVDLKQAKAAVEQAARGY